MAICPPVTSNTAIVNSYREESKSFEVSPTNSLINFEYDHVTVDRTTDPLREIFSFFLDSVPMGIIELTYSDVSKLYLTEAKRL
jgi:hypothetical protein